MKEWVFFWLRLLLHPNLKFFLWLQIIIKPWLLFISNPHSIESGYLIEPVRDATYSNTDFVLSKACLWREDNFTILRENSRQFIPLLHYWLYLSNGIFGVTLLVSSLLYTCKCNTMKRLSSIKILIHLTIMFSFLLLHKRIHPSRAEIFSDFLHWNVHFVLLCSLQPLFLFLRSYLWRPWCSYC